MTLSNLKSRIYDWLTGIRTRYLLLAPPLPENRARAGRPRVSILDLHARRAVTRIPSDHVEPGNRGKTRAQG